MLLHFDIGKFKLISNKLDEKMRRIVQVIQSPVSPSDIISCFLGWNSSRRAGNYKDLIVHSPSSLQQLPMGGAGNHVKGSRIDKNSSTQLAEDDGILRKSDIITDSDSNWTPGRFDNGRRMSCG